MFRDPPLYVHGRAAPISPPGSHILISIKLASPE
jgi:hypothetical protein